MMMFPLPLQKSMKMNNLMMQFLRLLLLRKLQLLMIAYFSVVSNLQLFRFLLLQSNQISMDSPSRLVRFHAFSMILARTSTVVTIMRSLLPKKTVT